MPALINIVSLAMLLVTLVIPAQSAVDEHWLAIAPYFQVPPKFENQFGPFKSPLQFDDGRAVTNAAQWAQRRAEIIRYWHQALGPWPAIIDAPALEILETSTRDNFVQKRIRLQVAPTQFELGYLLIPRGAGPFPGVVVPYYEPESSIGVGKTKLRDFASQLARRGFAALAIGSPGGDARQPDIDGAGCQPLSFLAYVAANCRNALANLPEVDPNRIGMVGHSYGGKWAMFAACLNEKFACGVWSDPGIVFDESKPNVNYWEPWYLGEERGMKRKPGLITTDNPRTGAYRDLVAAGRDLHELHALMAPRPFLVSGGSEDGAEQWIALNHSVAVNKVLGRTNRVAMTNRTGHDPTIESNEQIYRFFEHFLQARPFNP